MLPDGDGYTLCRELRASGSKARVLMLTARGLEDDLVTGLDAGDDDYMVKPYACASLSRACARCCGASPSHPWRRHRSCAAEPIASTCGPAKSSPTTAPASPSRVPSSTCSASSCNTRGARSRARRSCAVWGDGIAIDYHTVDNFVSQLKRKLGPDVPIRTIRGP